MHGSNQAAVLEGYWLPRRSELQPVHPRFSRSYRSVIPTGAKRRGGTICSSPGSAAALNRAPFPGSQFFPSAIATEVLSEQLLRPARSFFAKDNRLSLALWVRNVSLGVQTVN